MCVALPGRVTEIDGDRATVDFSGNIVQARGASIIGVSVGDSVLVHAGCIIQKVDTAEADMLTELMKEVSGL